MDRTNSLYLLDYWRATPWLLVELGLFRDIASNARRPMTRAITNTLWSPRLGFNFQIGPKHTLRLALMRYLDTHQILSPLLIPTEVAGLPWVEDVLPGAEVRQAGASWEAQWNNKTFTALRFTATRASIPQYFNAFCVDGTPYDYPAWTTWRRYQASLFYNRILTNWLGLRMGVLGKRLLPDPSFATTPFQASNNLESLSEMNAILSLSFLTPKGWQGGITNRVVYQYAQEPLRRLF